MVQNAKYGELSHEEILSIVQQLIDCGVMAVSLTGGEPLVRREFMEIVDALLAGGIRITTIYSNGRLVTDQLLDQLEERGRPPGVQHELRWRGRLARLAAGY